jgi:UDP-N-acetylmuramyl pentapeptide phosphotransferase/UDP-N-acetylglucosamine-1-phosphate transferase
MSGGANVAYWAIIAGIPILAAALCAGILVALMPWLKSYALARPVARSSHREPTPQGGGLGVIIATFCVVWLAATTTIAVPQGTLAQLSALTGAVALLALVGFLDDMHGLSPGPRLLVQCLAVGLIVTLLPSDARLFTALPLWLERAGVLLAGIWFVNLVNFMDGIDWMTVAEAVPITAAVAIFGLGGIVPPTVTLVALALLGAMLGFAPFNRPVARLFLGDVGSLPIGLVLGWLLLLLAASGHFAAALLLPLYYLADASITLFLRFRRGETVWKAHRTHFYQRAVAGGLTVPAVVARVFATNVVLAALAAASVVASTTIVSVLCLTGGVALVGFLLAHFARARG